ncbi:MAG: EVE domain-containing protein [Bacteroidota bacterium]
MNHWLVKSDPETYSWPDLLKDGSTVWDGVRNHLAKRHLASMKKNDKVLVYHSMGESSVVGTATVIREGFEDPKAPGEGWVAVELKAGKSLKRPVTLKEIKSDKILKGMELVRMSRLSVMPVRPEEYDKILELASSK